MFIFTFYKNLQDAKFTINFVFKMEFCTKTW